MLITDQIYVLDKDGNKIPFTGKLSSVITQDIKIIELANTGTTNILLDKDFYSYQCTLNKTATFNFDLTGLVLDEENISICFELKLILPDVVTVVFNQTLDWEEGIAPSFNRPGTYFLCFRSDDKGDTWLAAYQGFWSV